MHSLDISTNFSTKPQFSRLHCPSFFGIVDLVVALIGMGCYDINEGDLAGHTQLLWAGYNGHDKAGRILLERRCT